MKRDGTPRNVTPLEPLSPVQENAIAGLLAGKTITDAAAEAGVDRATVHRWLRDCFAFQAAINAGRREMRDAVCGRLERLAAKAADCLERAIDGGDVKAALEIVKGMGILAPNPIGSEDTSQLAAEAEGREKKQEQARLFLSMGMG